MRHQKKRHKLGRTTPHRKATLAALGSALIQHKRITTTVTKAKALRVYIEPLITRAKEDTSHNRRQVFRRLHDNASVSELFTEVSAQVGDRPGGYTRIIKLGRRAGDGAPMAVIELVDYNDVQPEGTRADGKRTRRGGGRGRRRGGQTKSTAPDQTKSATSTEEATEIETTGDIETPAEAETASDVDSAPAADSADEPRKTAAAADEPVSEEADASAVADVSESAGGERESDETTPSPDEADELDEEDRKDE